ncbi:MAG: hypothetical protein ACE360_04010 [Hyphomicrobiales bacterium]
MDGLSSADPIVRIVTLEEAMNSTDTNLRRLALNTALGSGDTLLRSAALDLVFAVKPSYIIQITASSETNSAQTVLENSGGNIDMNITEYVAETGDFNVYSSRSRVRNGEYVKYAGNFSGDRVSFSINLGQIVSSGVTDCRITSYLAEGSTVLSGDMMCGDREGYSVEIDVVR